MKNFQLNDLVDIQNDKKYGICEFICLSDKDDFHTFRDDHYVLRCPNRLSDEEREIQKSKLSKQGMSKYLKRYSSFHLIFLNTKLFAIRKTNVEPSEFALNKLPKTGGNK